jgi:hypothetical protein
MYNKSRKPFVINRQNRVPFDSSKAFVATVVPIRIHSICSGSIKLSVVFILASLMSYVYTDYASQKSIGLSQIDKLTFSKILLIASVGASA